MTDIIEKVAQAILEQEWGQPVEKVFDEDRRLARAAIRATLEAMQDRLFKRGIDPSANDYIDQLIQEIDEK